MKRGNGRRTTADDLKEIETIFNGYVFGFMKFDIGREIHIAKLKSDDALKVLGPYIGGANVLSALGLMCYTEFLGSFVTGKKGFGQSRANGEALLNKMGNCYQEELKQEPKLWDTFRNGLAHEYVVKGNCTIFMCKGDEKCGIGKTDSGYFFVVERYYEDLMSAAYQLYEDLQVKPILPVEN